MTGTTVVITGGASGIGLATAEIFAGQGWRVALVDRDRPALDAARERLGLPGFTCDVASAASVSSAAAEVLRAFDTVDVLVNNAGVSQPKTVVELTVEEWNATLGVNLTGAFLWSKALLPGMLARRQGRIINVSSVSAKHGGGGGTVSRACYAASKAGLLGFTRGLAREVAPHVLVNAVCPGMIETPMTRALIARAHEQLVAGIPLARLGQASDVAGIIWMLSTPFAAYLTGEVIDVNGGLYID